MSRLGEEQRTRAEDHVVFPRAESIRDGGASETTLHGMKDSVSKSRDL